MEAKWTLLAIGLALAGGLAFGMGMADDDPARTDDTDRDSGSSSDVENDFLLDGPRPAAHADVSGGSEPMILTDPSDPDQLWIGDTSGIYRSTDDGETWSELPNPFNAQADGIQLVRDDAGTLYATVTNAAANEFARSDNDGLNWDAGPLIPIPGSRPVDGGGVADRPWLAAAGDGRLAMLWNPGTNPPGTRCLSSFDGGQTWPDRGAGKSTIIAGPPVFAGEGEARDLYWSIRGTVYRVPDVSLGSANHLCQFATTQENVIDAGDQPMYHTASHGDTVYTTAPDADNENIVVAGAENWPSFSKVTIEPTTAGGSSLNQNTFATVSATERSVAVTWYGTEAKGDFTSDGFEGEWNVYVAEIADFFEHEGETLTCSSEDLECTRLTTQPNHEGPICTSGITCSTDRDLLDYFGIDHGPSGDVHVAYADDETSAETRTMYAQID